LGDADEENGRAAAGAVAQQVFKAGKQEMKQQQEAQYIKDVLD